MLTLPPGVGGGVPGKGNGPENPRRMEEKLTEESSVLWTFRSLAFSWIPLGFRACHSVSLECHPECPGFCIWDQPYNQCIDITWVGFFSYRKARNNLRIYLTSAGISKQRQVVLTPQANFQFLESRHGTLIFVSYFPPYLLKNFQR